MLRSSVGDVEQETETNPIQTEEAPAPPPSNSRSRSRSSSVVCHSPQMHTNTTPASSKPSSPVPAHANRLSRDDSLPIGPTVSIQDLTQKPAIRESFKRSRTADPPAYRKMSYVMQPLPLSVLSKETTAIQQRTSFTRCISPPIGHRATAPLKGSVPSARTPVATKKPLTQSHSPSVSLAAPFYAGSRSSATKHIASAAVGPSTKQNVTTTGTTKSAPPLSVNLGPSTFIHFCNKNKEGLVKSHPNWTARKLSQELEKMWKDSRKAQRQQQQIVIGSAAH